MQQRKTAEEREESRIDLLTLLAVIIGLGAGLIALFIRLVIGLLTNVALIVVKDGKAVGVVTRHQLYEGASYGDGEMTVEQVCSKSYLTGPQEEYGYEAMRIMTQNDSQLLVVVDKLGKPVGSVSRSDLIQAQKQKIADDTIVEGGMAARILQRRESN